MSPPRVLRPDDPADLAAAVGLLADGMVLGVPTDTVYGLACDPASGAAVEAVYALKARPADLELSILGVDRAQLERHGRLEGVALRLAVAFWPGPLSLVVPVASVGGTVVPRRGTTVSVRIPACPALLALLRQAGPLATTSANRHGEPPATTWEECAARVPGVAAVIAGPPAGGQSSTIIDCTEAPPRLLRAGPLPLEVLRPYLGE